MTDREKYPSEAAERFQIRLPAGLRDRIKAYSEMQGRSMNTEIVRVLEREFPQPISLDDRIADLLSLTSVLKGGVSRAEINSLISVLAETVEGIAEGTIRGVDEKTRDSIGRRLESWRAEIAEDEADRASAGLDPVEAEALSRGRSTAKFPLDPDWRAYARKVNGVDLTEEQFEVWRLGYESGLAAQRQPQADLDDEDEQ